MQGVPGNSGKSRRIRGSRPQSRGDHSGDGGVSGRGRLEGEGAGSAQGAASVKDSIRVMLWFSFYFSKLML